MRDFEITASQRKAVSEWHESIKSEIIEAQRKTMAPDDFSRNTSDGKYPYYGSISGGLTYSFTPTGLGVMLVVTEHSTRKSINLTEYEKW